MINGRNTVRKAVTEFDNLFLPAADWESRMIWRLDKTEQVVRLTLE
jgi:hypothetical protein